MIDLTNLRAEIRAASWFAALAEPLTDGDLADARAYAGAIEVVGVKSWPEMEDSLKSSTGSVDWWNREETRRKSLLAEAEARHPGRALWASLSELTTETGDVVHGKAATAAARAGNAAAASIHVAAGAASPALYQLAGARLARQEASPLGNKVRLFAAGRWPPRVLGSRLILFCTGRHA